MIELNIKVIGDTPKSLLLNLYSLIVKARNDIKKFDKLSRIENLHWQENRMIYNYEINRK